jgi:hypothetical protein
VCAVPRKLLGAARSKLDSLPEKAQRLLKLASVMCSFSAHMLATLLLANDPHSAILESDVPGLLEGLIAENMIDRNLTVGE